MAGAKKKRCNACGARVDVDAKFCDRCGAEIMDEQRGSDHTVALALAIGCGVVLVICVLMIILLQVTSPKKETNMRDNVPVRKETAAFFEKETDSEEERGFTDIRESETEGGIEADLDAVHNRECRISGIVYFTDNMETPVIALNTPVSIYVNSTSGDKILCKDVDKITFGAYSYSDTIMKRQNNVEIEVSGSLWEEENKVFIDVKEIEGEIQETETETRETENTKEEAETKGTEGEKEEAYILPESNSRMLTESDVSDLSLKEINYAKNEIYARHGRKFDSKELETYFKSKSWYHPTVDPDDFSDKVFNSYEKKNAQFLAAKEESMQKGGYKLDQ